MNISAEMGDALKINTEGVLINGTLKGGPADKAGIQPGDVLKTINNKPVNNITQLLKQISEVPPGDKIKTTINRKGKNLDIEIQVGKRPGPKKR
jgi:serine protease DegQ